jgi:predicted lipoprotein with Yx(FWY)xxD motif
MLRDCHERKSIRLNQTGLSAVVAGRSTGGKTAMFLHHRVARAFVGIAGVALAAAACGGSSSGGNTQTVGTGSGGSSAPSSSSDLQTHNGPDGKYMTDEHGRTLYIFGADTSTTSMCSGACAKEWPPYKEDGSQVVFKGHPLYFFTDDTSAGDMKGQGLNDFGGLWTAVTPSGDPVASQPSSSPSSSGGSSEGWG